MSDVGSSFALAAAPRRVPLLLAIEVLFGGVLVQWGFVFFGMGSVMTWPLVYAVDVRAAFDFDEALVPVQAQVTACEPTSTADRNTPIVRVAFSYESPPGLERSAHSYLSAGCPAVGATLPAEHVPGRPERVRLVGGRTAPFEPWILFLLGFPALGLAFLVPGALHAGRSYGLLRSGLGAVGAVVSRKGTTTHINRRQVYAVTLEYKGVDGRKNRAVVKTHLVERLEEGTGVPLLYGPKNASLALPIALLPSGTTVTGGGELEGGSILRVLRAGIAPALVAAAILYLRSW